MSRCHLFAIGVVGLSLALGCQGSEPSEEGDTEQGSDREAIDEMLRKQQDGKGTGEALSGPATRRGIEGTGVSVDEPPGTNVDTGGSGGVAGTGGSGGIAQAGGVGGTTAGTGGGGGSGPSGP